MRLTVDAFHGQALGMIERLKKDPAGGELGELLGAIRDADLATSPVLGVLRGRIEELKERLRRSAWPLKEQLLTLADYLTPKSVWAVGGDGWAYDIGYGGVDQVLASGKNINVLVLDTEVYSNTGGQMSKATPLGAVAKFASAGKMTPKKYIGMIMATYGNIYVAQIAFGANPAQTVKAFHEAEAYDGPSLVVAYSTCTGHGIDMSKGIESQKKAVACGHWPLYRYNPDLRAQGKNPLVIDSKDPSLPVAEYVYGENRYRMLRTADPDLAARLLRRTEEDVKRRWNFLKHAAKRSPDERGT